MGGNCAVVILGGSRPHVGAVSAAYREEGNLHCETSASQGHRDDIVFRILQILEDDHDKIAAIEAMAQKYTPENRRNAIDRE